MDGRRWGTLLMLVMLGVVLMYVHACACAVCDGGLGPHVRLGTRVTTSRCVRIVHARVDDVVWEVGVLLTCIVHVWWVWC